MAEDRVYVFWLFLQFSIFFLITKIHFLKLVYAMLSGKIKKVGQVSDLLILL